MPLISISKSGTDTMPKTLSGQGGRFGGKKERKSGSTLQTTARILCSVRRTGCGQRVGTGLSGSNCETGH